MYDEILCQIHRLRGTLLIHFRGGSFVSLSAAFKIFTVNRYSDTVRRAELRVHRTC